MRRKCKPSTTVSDAAKKLSKSKSPIIRSRAGIILAAHKKKKHESKTLLESEIVHNIDHSAYMIKLLSISEYLITDSSFNFGLI